MARTHAHLFMACFALDSRGQKVDPASAAAAAPIASLFRKMSLALRRSGFSFCMFCRF